uniref:Uncharacterized protein n=1 Tax=Arundo donax TaxID=35708 RepID=A0A0A8ZNL8_ARUDO
MRIKKCPCLSYIYVVTKQKCRTGLQWPDEMRRGTDCRLIQLYP